MSTPNIQRLKILRERVLAAKPEKFNMITWKCGTTYCAAGHYVIGARTEEERMALFQDLAIPSELYGYDLDRHWSLSIARLEKHFELSNEQVQNLFFTSAYWDTRSVTQEDVVARIDEIIQEANDRR